MFTRLHSAAILIAMKLGSLTLVALLQVGFGLFTVSGACAWPLDEPDFRRRYAGDAVAHYDKGLALQMAGNLDDAVKEYKAAVDIDDHMLEAWDILRCVYHAQGKSAAEKEASQKEKALSRQEAAKLNQDAEKLFTRGKFSAAIVLWEKAKMMDPDLDTTDLRTAELRLECEYGAMATW